ncbi:MAG: hypothetical protein P4M11_08280 [Candidatus Pacebacteria bacterium]|nr:hypothetical protein [Candidatus Paceibacterota bacterium]
MVEAKKLYHTESYETSSVPRKVARKSFVQEHKNSWGTCTPTRRQSGLGRSRGISLPVPVPGVVHISHRKSFDVELAPFAETNDESVRRTATTSSRRLAYIRDEESVAAKRQSALEEDKEPLVWNTRVTSERTTSSSTETPLRGSELTFASTVSQLQAQSPAALQASRSPHPLQSKLRRGEFSGLISCAQDPDNPFHHLYECKRRSSASVEAYKDFLFTLFGSIALMHQLSPVLNGIRPVPKLNLPRPTNVTCKSSIS